MTPTGYQFGPSIVLRNIVPALFVNTSSRDSLLMNSSAALLIVVRLARSTCKNSRRPFDPGLMDLIISMALSAFSLHRPAM